MVLARDEESWVLKLEAEMRAASETPLPRQGLGSSNPPPRPHVPVAERLNFRSLVSRLDTWIPNQTPKTKECHVCHTIAHIAILVRNKGGGMVAAMVRA